MMDMAAVYQEYSLVTMDIIIIIILEHPQVQVQLLSRMGLDMHQEQMKVH